MKTSKRSVLIVDSDADEDEIRRGIEAAEAVFERHGLTPAYCDAQVTAEANGIAYDARAAAAWREADTAAITACCAGWPRIPEAAHIELA